MFRLLQSTLLSFEEIGAFFKGTIAVTNCTEQTEPDRKLESATVPCYPEASGHL